MANSIIIEVVRPRLLGVLAQAQAISGIAHPGIKGRLREILIRDAIAPFLPPSVEVLTGTIVSVDAHRTHRTQDDLVIFDREAAPLLWEAEQAVIPIEGVVSHIEVKSKLTRADVRDALLSAGELRNLSSGTAPTGILFAYDSDLSTSEATRLMSIISEDFVPAVSGQSTSPVQMICVGTRGTWVLIDRGEQGWYFVPPVDGRHLLAFVSIISNSVYKVRSGRPGVGSYLLDPSWLEGPDPKCPLLVP
jgi:hypothetical protein